MKLYRIAKKKYAADITGEGAKIYGGRWNRPGLAVLYTSESRALALLELIVHFSSKAAFKENYYFLSFEVNENLIESLDHNILPKNEIDLNDNRLWNLADYYFLEKKIAALRVPSVLIPQEYNIILNPKHFELKHLSVIDFEPIVLDERFKSTST